MNRAVLKLTNEEAAELIKSLDIQKYTGTPLSSKLSSIDLSIPEIEIFLSEDEIESILDQVGIIDQNTNPQLFSAINKINELIGSFHY